MQMTEFQKTQNESECVRSKRACLCAYLWKRWDGVLANTLCVKQSQDVCTIDRTPT